ncbi:MAG: hypothetical protein DI527_04185 [Chelatococcus sp.]|nr:MAG: hypothetical protein DI527_04185 [Chelatococcus sp.]
MKAVAGMIALTMALAFGTSAQAALAPAYQRAAEIAAAVDAAAALLPRNPIESVVLSAPDRFTIRGGNCTVTVEILDEPAVMAPTRAGPRKFTARAGKPVCAR